MGASSNTGDCTYCQGDVEHDDAWRVPGEPPEDKWKGEPKCHCGHDAYGHSFHVKFCRQCLCYSLHFAGENYDDIHDRWN